MYKEGIYKEAEKLVATLKAKSISVAVAESLTSGKLQDALASISGASSVYHGGMTAYNFDMKVKYLSVNAVVAKACNCVSKVVAEQMAIGVRDAFESMIGIGTTGYAEPDKNNGINAPMAWIGIIIGDNVINLKVNGDGLTREEIRQKVVFKALEKVNMILND